MKTYFTGILFVLLTGCTGTQQPPAQNNTTIINVNPGEDAGVNASSSSSGGMASSSSSSSSSGSMASSSSGGPQGDAGPECAEPAQCGTLQLCDRCLSVNYVDGGPCVCANIAPTTFCEEGHCVQEAKTAHFQLRVTLSTTSTVPESVLVTVVNSKVPALCSGNVPCPQLHCSDFSGTLAGLYTQYPSYNIVASTVWSRQFDYETGFFEDIFNVPVGPQMVIIEAKTQEYGLGISIRNLCHEIDNSNPIANHGVSFVTEF